MLASAVSHTRNYRAVKYKVAEITLCPCYAKLCAVLWVGGVDAYTVGSPLLVCACYVAHPCVCPSSRMPD